jgi:hypothetical protein
MKKIFILTIVILAATAISQVSAQVMPPGGSDRDLRDTNVKGRSNELERIDRDARKEAAKKKNKSEVNPAAPQPEDKLAAKYDEIKTDYEQIQLSQDSIIKAYQGEGKIDYSQISKFSSEINKSALRLNSNLFPVPLVKKSDAEGKVENSDQKNGNKTDQEIKKPKSVGDLIVELDNTIGSFATSPMFQNLRVVDAAVSEKTKSDLEKIIELSQLLNMEAAKMTEK